MPTNDYVISLLLNWSQRVQQSAEERRRLAEEREEADWRAVQIEMDNITRRRDLSEAINEEQRHWNYENVSAEMQGRTFRNVGRIEASE